LLGVTPDNCSHAAQANLTSPAARWQTDHILNWLADFDRFSRVCEQNASRADVARLSNVGQASRTCPDQFDG
jgi:hypothetical protein